MIANAIQWKRDIQTAARAIERLKAIGWQLAEIDPNHVSTSESRDQIGKAILALSSSVEREKRFYRSEVSRQAFTTKKGKAHAKK